MVAPLLIGLVLSTAAFAQPLDAAEVAAVGQYGDKASPVTVFEKGGALYVDGRGLSAARLTPTGGGRYVITGGGEL
ncbi:MAG TPA: peptidase M15, partial [Caulobacter sp.]|nr:peptidase M15 [Caulobacter sp.]